VIEPHPAALIFPTVVGAEFDAFVEDVRQNGQREPGKVDVKTGLLLDGLTRQRACEALGVPFRADDVDLNGDDPVAYVVSLNVKRRNLSASQRAVVAAEASRFSTQFDNAERRQLAQQFGTNETYLSNARALVERDPGAAERVKAGTQHLVDAYDELRQRERKQETRADKVERLKADRPDLAERVDSETITVDEALDLAEADERRERDQAKVALDQLTRAVLVLADDPVNAEALLDRLDKYGSPFTTSASDCRLAIAYLVVLAERQEARDE
jgi:hypothetical protein